MPTSIFQTEGPDYGGTPRRMSTEDVRLWWRWRQVDKTPWLKFHFDVGVGPGRDAGEVTDPRLRGMWQTSTQKRIDVLAEAPAFVAIVELRQHAQPNALGRLLVYKDLYLQDPLDERPVELWLVTDTPDPELARISRGFGVHYVVV